METNSSENTEKKLRPRRPIADRIAELQNKIEKKKSEIVNLESKLVQLKNPSPRARRKPSMKSVLDKAKEAGMTPAEIAAKLGL